MIEDNTETKITRRRRSHDDEDYNWEAWTYYYSTYQEYKDFIDNYQNISKSENNYQIISFDDENFHVSSLRNKNKAILI